MKKLPIKEVKSSTKLFFAVGAFFFLLALSSEDIW